MPDHVDLDSPPSMTSLLAGIVEDIQNLVRQEISLARQEMRQEWEKTKTAIGSMAIGAGMLAFSSILLVFMLVYLLNWLTSDRIPLWGCFGIIGGVIAAVGVCLLLFGKQRASEIHVVPPRTAETLKENVQWIKNQT
jgi:hypothetical protein